MSHAGLSPARAQCYAFIKASIELRGVHPTIDEIRVAMGRKSKSGIHRLVEHLISLGYLKRKPGVDIRAIELAHEDVRCPNCGHPLSGKMFQ